MRWCDFARNGINIGIESGSVASDRSQIFITVAPPQQSDHESELRCEDEDQLLQAAQINHRRRPATTSCAQRLLPKR